MSPTTLKKSDGGGGGEPSHHGKGVKLKAAAAGVKGVKAGTGGKREKASGGGGGGGNGGENAIHGDSDATPGGDETPGKKKKKVHLAAGALTKPRRASKLERNGSTRTLLRALMSPTTLKEKEGVGEDSSGGQGEGGGGGEPSHSSKPGADASKAGGGKKKPHRLKMTRSSTTRDMVSPGTPTPSGGGKKHGNEKATTTSPKPATAAPPKLRRAVSSSRLHSPKSPVRTPMVGQQQQGDTGTAGGGQEVQKGNDGKSDPQAPPGVVGLPKMDEETINPLVPWSESDSTRPIPSQPPLPLGAAGEVGPGRAALLNQEGGPTDEQAGRRYESAKKLKVRRDRRQTLIERAQTLARTPVGTVMSAVLYARAEEGVDTVDIPNTHKKEGYVQIRAGGEDSSGDDAEVSAGVKPVVLTYLFELKLGEEEEGLYVWLHARCREGKGKISSTLKLEPSSLHRKSEPPKLLRMKAQRAVLALGEREELESSEKYLGEISVPESDEFIWERSSISFDVAPGVYEVRVTLRTAHTHLRALCISRSTPVEGLDFSNLIPSLDGLGLPESGGGSLHEVNKGAPKRIVPPKEGPWDQFALTSLPAGYRHIQRAMEPEKCREETSPEMPPRSFATALSAATAKYDEVEERFTVLQRPNAMKSRLKSDVLLGKDIKECAAIKVVACASERRKLVEKEHEELAKDRYENVFSLTKDILRDISRSRKGTEEPDVDSGSSS